MSDNKNISGPEDGKRINIHESYELRDWSQKFGVTPDELKQAVKTVGDSAEKVKKHLGK